MSALHYLAYPPTSLPIRDLFILDHVSIAVGSEVMEVGVGCGETAARLARMCKRVVGVDISAPTINALSYLERRIPNLELSCMDVTLPGSWANGEFDTVVSMDTLEHVADAKAYFDFIWRHLAEGGTAHVLFPNEILESMHGITRLGSEAELLSACRSARGDVELFAVHLNRWARTVTHAAYGWFCRMKPRTKGEVAPQRFDETAFFSRMERWKRWSPFINAYWYVVLWKCRWVKPVYAVRPLEATDFDVNTHIYVRLTSRLVK